MPEIKAKGLRGLDGLSSLTPEEQASFMSANADRLDVYRNPRRREQAANILYMNRKFINTFGKEAFDKMNDGSEDAFNARNYMLKDKVSLDAINKLAPFRKDGRRDNSIGFGENWEKVQSLSPDARIELLNSPFLTPAEFKKKWDSMKALNSWDEVQKATVLTGFGVLMQGTRTIPWLIDKYKNGVKDSDLGTAVMTQFLSTETGKKHDYDRNQAILDKIYNNDIKKQAKQLDSNVAKAYNSLLDLSDTQIKKEFIKMITPGSYKDRNGNMNRGIPDYASRYGNGKDVSSEMQDFSIDDMRKVIAKKMTYDTYMSPDMAATVLNNEAKDYIKDNQGVIKITGLFLNDVAISTLSYTADGINGMVLTPWYAFKDFAYGKPVVAVDTDGNVIDQKKIAIKKDNNGLYYQGADKKLHRVNMVSVDRSTLHHMGKEEDGSDIKGAFGIDGLTVNPLYWSRAEQFGTLDEDEQKQYEKLGSSPYQVSWGVDNDGSILYESGKMISFGIADKLWDVLPFGIGKIGKGLKGLSKVTRGLGKALETTGKAMSQASKSGQIIQGVKGATGIAYAYSRGSFQETLQKNYANLEQATLEASQQSVYNRYTKDKKYKASVDAQINALAQKKRAQIEAEMRKGEGKYIYDQVAINKRAHELAQQEVTSSLIQQEVERRKGSKEYAQMQQKAIDGASNTALMTFLPEAVKYGFVNTLGYRKFLYRNAAGTTQRINKGLKDVKEVVTEEGKRRLKAEGKQFLTSRDKWKKIGKTTISQFWGGAWTNGTDDMQVDAAERVNEDSYSRYLDAYRNGEALAATYGFIDGMRSYVAGAQASLGEDSTWRAALVGGLGSVGNVTPQFINMAKLATKKGREAYKNEFWREPEKDKDDKVLRNDDGSIKYKKTSKWHNLGAQANYLLNNGVLNTYYANKQSAAALRDQVDYVNGILDRYEDFKDIEKLVAADMASREAKGTEDEKTLEFTKALLAVHALNNLARNSDDPAKLSSVVQDAKESLAKAAQLAKVDLDKGEENPLSEEDTKNFLKQYYAANPGKAQSMYEDRQGLKNIGHNAQKLIDASKALDKAEKEISKIERNKGYEIDPEIRFKLKEQQALDGHWRDRKEKLQHEIDDPGTEDAPTDAATVLATVGGKDMAKSLLVTYKRQERELKEEQKELSKERDKAWDKYLNAKDALEEAKKGDNSDAIYQVEKAYKEAEAEYKNSIYEFNHINDLLEETRSRAGNLRESINEVEKDSEAKDKVLTADEIFALDPHSRAKMMNKENRRFYSEEQQKEIEKLEKRLLMRDADALNKIQDISTLTYRIDANRDAYRRIAEDPKAAVVAAEYQRFLASNEAYNLLRQKIIEGLTDFAKTMDSQVGTNPDFTQEMSNEFIYAKLIGNKTDVLDAMVKENLLPEHSQLLKDARDRAQTVEDLTSVVAKALKDVEWKNNIWKNIDSIIDHSRTKADILNNLEQVIKDNPDTAAADDFEYVLSKMEEQGYQRDATVVEEREKKKERENEAKAQREIEKKRAEAAAEAATQTAEERQQQAFANGQTEQSGELEAVDLLGKGVESTESNSAAESSNEEGGEKPVEFDYTNANQLMADDVQEGSISLGKTVVKNDAGKLQQAPITVERKGNKIALSAGGKETRLTVSSNKFEDSSNTKPHGEDTPFEVTSMEKRDGDWYLNGNFAGDSKKTEVKAKEEFDLDKAIKDNEVALSDLDPTSAENITVLDDGTVVAETPSLEQQAAERQYVGERVTLTDVPSTVADDNAVSTKSSEVDSAVLSGNGMSRYDSKTLATKHVAKKKQGRKKGDAMNQFYAWMDAAGIKLQNIIDFELPSILRDNPQAKVKFMSVKPEENATNDAAMKNHLMLVLDYDDSINKGITKIHNDDNGGVIESNGKKYLIIGTAGFATNNTAQHELYDTLWWPGKEGGLNLKSKRAEFFKEHKNERFWVSEEYSTEIKPASQIPGYIVKQLEGDEKQQDRSVIELLNDEERNPYHRKLERVVWGIQQANQLLVINNNNNTPISYPRDAVDNQGRAFVFVPSSNGKLVPVALKPLFYQEMKEGTLTKEVENLLDRAVNPNTAQDSYNDAIAALKGLCNVFYLRKGMMDIHRKGKTITLEHNGQTEDFDLDNAEERQKFKEAFAQMNPRVNITATVFQSKESIEKYSEAGALSTDVALFGTVGSSYNVYGLDGNGNMIKPTEISNKSNSTTGENFRKTEKQIVYNHSFYVENNGEYTLNGVPVIDVNLISQLNYLKRILDNALIPVKTEGTEDYYILNTGDNPEAVKVDKNSKKVTEISQEEAAKLIEEIKAKKEAELREKKAAEALKAAEETKGTGEEDNAGEIKGEGETPAQDPSLEHKPSEEVEDDLPFDDMDDSENTATHQTPPTPATPSAELNKPSTQTFKDFSKRKQYRGKIIKLLIKKFGNKSLNAENYIEDLKKAGMEVERIGTSKEDMDAWIKTLEDCR